MHSYVQRLKGKKSGFSQRMTLYFETYTGAWPSLASWLAVVCVFKDAQHGSEDLAKSLEILRRSGENKPSGLLLFSGWPR